MAEPTKASGRWCSPWRVAMIGSLADVEEIEEEEVTAKEDIPESQEQEKAVLEPHNFRIQDNDLGAGGPKAKYKANMEASLSTNSKRKV